MDDHVGSRGSQLQGDRPANAAGRAGHQGFQPRQFLALNRRCRPRPWPRRSTLFFLVVLILVVLVFVVLGAVLLVFGIVLLPQLANGDAQAGVDRAGTNFREGFQDETARVHARVRNGQLGRFLDQIAVEQDVEIDGARGVAFTADPAEFLLDFEQDGQQFLGLQVGLDFGDGIEIRLLIGRAADRIGFVEGGNLRQFDARVLLDRLQGLVEIRLPIAQVTAQSEERGDTHKDGSHDEVQTAAIQIGSLSEAASPRQAPLPRRGNFLHYFS